METRRIIHTMLRVGDMAKSIRFYTHVMGMKVLRTFESPEQNYSLTFLGFGVESESCLLELTCNFGVSKYDLGTGYGHIAIGVEDCYQACADIKARGAVASLARPARSRDRRKSLPLPQTPMATGSS